MRETFGSFRGFARTAWLTVAGPRRVTPADLAAGRRPKKNATSAEACASAR